MLPKSLDKPPVSDATVEIRFRSQLPPDAIFGVVYTTLQADFSRTEKMPILDIPDEIRSKDPAFQYQPYYRLMNDDYILQVGPRMLSLSPQLYPGWTTFFARISSVFSRVIEARVAASIDRIGVRYINALESTDIGRALRLSINLQDQAHESPSTFIRTVLKSGEFSSTLQVANSATFTIRSKRFSGTVLDIDTFTDSSFASDFAALSPVIDRAHTATKELFFGLLRPEYLTTLGPQYEH